MYVVTTNGRIQYAANEKFEPADEHVVFDFPDDFDFAHMQDYKIQSGELVYDPLPAPTPIPTSQEQTDALLADHEERLIYMELGV